MPYVVTDQRIGALFRRLNAGELGVAREDRDYLSALDRITSGRGAEAVGADEIAALDAESCLVLLRYYDRAGRFGGGVQAAAHARGVLHALVGRLLELELARGREEKADPGSGPG